MRKVEFAQSCVDGSGGEANMLRDKIPGTFIVPTVNTSMRGCLMTF